MLLFNIVTANATIACQRFPFAAVSNYGTCQCTRYNGASCKGRCTTDGIFRVLSWAMAAWKSGIYPTKRDDGVAFAASDRIGDRRRAAWGRAKRRMRCKGDASKKRAVWIWLKSIMNFVGWKAEGKKKHVCFKCDATATGEHLFTQVGMDASWRDTMTSHIAYMVAALAQHGHVKVDQLHAGDLGVTQAILGNLLWELFCLCDGTMKNPLSTLQDMKVWLRLAAKGCGVDLPISDLTIGMFKKSGKPPRLRAKGGGVETSRADRLVHPEELFSPLPIRTPY